MGPLLVAKSLPMLENNNVTPSGPIIDYQMAPLEVNKGKYVVLGGSRNPYCPASVVTKLQTVEIFYTPPTGRKIKQKI